VTGEFPTGRLRQALEAAIRVAREGEDADPVEPAPSRLRRYLTLDARRLPANALSAVRRVLEDDSEFRRRVIDGTSEEEVGEAGWLWLTRPDGADERLKELTDEAERRERDRAERKVARSLERELATSEEARRRADAEVAKQKERARTARAGLDAERTRRREAEREVAALRRELARAEETTAAAEVRLAAAAADLARLEAERDDALSRLAEAGPAAPPPPPVDLDGLAEALADATAALARAATLLDFPRSVTPTSRKARREGDKTRVGELRPEKRKPVKLPGAVLDDGVEAAEYLVRVANVLLLVDGYNISNALSPGQPLVDQRTRLVDALRELQSRTGAAVEVVFDGAGVTEPGGLGGRGGVHVRFSPAGVEADDVLIDVIASQPASRPVVLATSDRELRDRARRQGANLLGARQLLAVMRR
jgi:predicted RNA-binding protein with PIN domain